MFVLEDKFQDMLTHARARARAHTHTHTHTHTVLRTFKNPKFDWVYETTPEKHCKVGTKYCLCPRGGCACVCVSASEHDRALVCVVE